MRLDNGERGTALRGPDPGDRAGGARPRRLTHVLATVFSIAVLLAQPASVAATAYSTVLYVFAWSPPGSTTTAMCEQSGMVDIARNYGQALAKVNSNCATSRTLPPGYIGVLVDGYIETSPGSGFYQLCGNSGWYLNNVATAGWQLWITLCNNPSGTQTFYSEALGEGYNGSGYSRGNLYGVRSPFQNY